jgi:hypothetical protein
MSFADFSQSVYEACRASPRVFVLNPRFRRGNFYFQQLRCLALVREMVRHGDLARGQHEAIVVGAGVAGLTTAAAILTSNFSVQLVDHARSFHHYAEANHRELHPNIIAWPFQPLRAMTNLPFLNWTCASAPEVTKQILRQWKDDFASKVASVDSTVTKVREVGGGVEVECQNGEILRAHVAVLTTGWSREKPVGSFRGPSYWSQQSFEAPGEITVSGSGDGGLIDCAFQTYGPKAVAAARMLAYLLNEKPHKQRIQDAESEAQALFEAGDVEGAHEKLDGFYSRMAIENEDSAVLMDLVRPAPMQTRLYHLENTAYSPGSAPINKALFATLTKGSSPRATKVRAMLTQDAKGEILASDATPPSVLDKTRLLIRHGADAAAWSLLDSAAEATLKSVKTLSLDDMVPDEFDIDFYVANAPRRIAPSPSWRTEIFRARARRQIEAMLAHIAVDEDDKIQLIADNESEWEVRAGLGLRRDLKALFPIETEAFTVRLVESPKSRFVALS